MKTSVNELTGKIMSTGITSESADKNYRDNYDAIFGKKKIAEVKGESFFHDSVECMDRLAARWNTSHPK